MQFLIQEKEAFKLKFKTALVQKKLVFGVLKIFKLSIDLCAIFLQTEDGPGGVPQNSRSGFKGRF